MRQAFAIPIVDEIPNAGSEKETDNEENSNNNENNFAEANNENNTEIKAIGAEDLDSLFSLQELRGA